MRTTTQTVEPVRIGALARKTGCSVPTIRYYEEIGLIPRAKRRSSGHRIYEASAAQLIGFIRRCRDYGFTIEQIRSLAAISRNKMVDCAQARDIAAEHLRGVREKMLELMALERALVRFVDDCNKTCAGNKAPECTILKELGLADTPRNKASCCG